MRDTSIFFLTNLKNRLFIGNFYSELIKSKTFTPENSEIMPDDLCRIIYGFARSGHINSNMPNIFTAFLLSQVFLYNLLDLYR